MNYTIIIRWSAEDNTFIATIPEFDFAKTHGETEEETLKNAKEIIELLEDAYKQEGISLPTLKEALTELR